MKKSFSMAGLMLALMMLAGTGLARAQGYVGGAAGAKSATAFVPLSQTLEQLLNDGYEIHTSAGEEGNVLFLVKQDGAGHAKWVRCQLVGDQNGNTMMIYSKHPVSVCRAVN